MSARTQAESGPPTSALTRSKDAVQQARNLEPDAGQEDVKQVWEDLCQHYLRALQAGLVHEAFPYWILHNIPGHTIDHLMKVVYHKGTGIIEAYYPSLISCFGVPGWHFNLFLGPLPQLKARALHNVTKDRTDTFDDLYRELCRIRSQDQDLQDGPLNFTVKEIKSCFRNNDSDNNYESDVDSYYQTSSGSGDDDIIHVTEGSEDNHHSDNEHNNANSFDDNFTNPVGHGPPTHAPDAQRSEADHNVTLSTGQLGSDQKQIVNSGPFEANEVPNSEPIVDIGVWDHIGADAQRQNSPTIPDDNLSSFSNDYSPIHSTLPSSAPENEMNNFKRGGVSDNAHPSQTARLETFGFEDGTATVYSFSTASSAKYDGEKYQAEFGLALSDYISSLSKQENDVSRVVKDLPKLLQTFTRKIGSEKSSQINRDIMRYIHKHRMPIMRKCEENVSRALQEDSEQREGNSAIKPRDEDPSSRDKVLGWLNAEESDQRRNDTPGDGDMFEGVKDGDDDNDGDDGFSPALTEFSRVVKTSHAYNWLLKALKHDLEHSIAGDPHLDKIRDVIFSHDVFRRISRRSPPVECSVEYVVDWNPLEFIQSQEYEDTPKEVIAKALTLTGSPTEAEALTCSTYIERTWSESGRQFMTLLQKLFDSEKGLQHHTILDVGTTITASLRNTDSVFTVTGQPDTVVEIGEQISWISCALRNSDIEGAVTCTPTLRKVTETGRTASSVSLKLEISADITPIDLGLNDQGFCWRSLFRSPLLVQGYPTASRPVQGVLGVEMSLDIMMALTRTRHVVLFKNKLFVKGHSTILVAIREVNNVVQWHVVSNKDGQYIEYHDGRVDTFAPDLGDPTEILDLLPEKRHVVGWWPLVHIRAGTSVASLNIRGSGLPAPKPELVFERFTLSISKYVGITSNIALGKRDMPIQINKEGGSYYDQIDRALQRYVVFYDTVEQRAWLLDGATALLHLVRASIDAKERNGFSVINKNHDIQEKEGPPEQSAVRTLTDPFNMNLKLFKQYIGEDRKAETKHPLNASGQLESEITVTMNTGYQLFSDKVRSILTSLDGLHGHQSDISPNGMGLRILKSSLRNLHGFDFKDVAGDETRFHPKVAKLEYEAVWVNLIRRLHAITLFGTGFGNILEPEDITSAENAQLSICSAWSQVPCGHNYLAVSNMTLKRIIEHEGGSSKTPRLVARELYWECPDKYCETCSANAADPATLTRNSCCDRAQVLRQKSMLSSGPFRGPNDPDIPAHGGTIFGVATKSRLRRQVTGDVNSVVPASTVSHSDGTFSSMLSTTLRGQSFADSRTP